MQISVCEKSKVQYISVWGEIESKEDAHVLLETLNKRASNEVIITFLEASILPVDVIDKLSELQEIEKFRIHVTRRYLYSYLYSLGIKVRLVIQNKPFYEKKTETYCSINESLDEKEVFEFLNDIYNIYGYDYREYQIQSIMRRIRIAMLRENIYELSRFREVVISDLQTFESLFLDFSINTTDFFRDSQVFYNIRNKVLPYLKSYPHIKIWCAGCSTGKEVYSLAILLKECGILNKSQIYATDINPYVIEEAKNGIYSIETLDKDIGNYRKSGGEKSFTEYFNFNKEYMVVEEEIKNKILFFQHSLVGPGSLNEFQLILCRNVMIYFNNSLQRQVIESFSNSLSFNGFLVLGKSEGLLQNGGSIFFNKVDEENKIYKKR